MRYDEDVFFFRFGWLMMDIHQYNNKIWIDIIVIQLFILVLNLISWLGNELGCFKVIC
jgi:hypothetical protein